MYCIREVDTELQKGIENIKYGNDMKILPDKLEGGWCQWLEDRGLDDPSLNKQ